MINQRYRPDVPYLLLLALAPALLFWRWLLLGQVLYWGTLLLQFWPWHFLVKQQLLAGQWPLWNNLLGNGTPLLANLQSAVFYPPNLLFLLLPVEHALTLSVLLHLSLAGLLMYAYARYLGLSRLAATLSALSFMFSGYLLGRTQFIPMIHSAAWLPLLLLLTDRLVTRRRRPDILWLALAIALQLLAGHAQLSFYSMLLVGAYALWRGWPTLSMSPLRRLWAIGRRLGLAVALALLLAAVQLLPTAELVSQSPRGEGANRYEALSYSYWPWRLVTLLAPDFFGNPAQNNYWGYATFWEDHAFIGTLPLLLLLFTLWRSLKPYISRHQPRPAPASSYLPPAAGAVLPFFVALLPLSLLLAMGWNTPLYPFLFDYVPGFGLFRGPARLLIWYTVAAALLAGMGVMLFQEAPRNRPAWQRLLVVSLAITIAGVVGSLYLTGRSLTFVNAARSAGLWLAVSIVLLLLYPGQRKFGRLKPGRWTAAVIGLVGLELLLNGLPLLPMQPAEVYRRPLASAQAIQAGPPPQRYFIDPEFVRVLTFDQYFQFEAWGPAETDHWQRYRETLTPNFGVAAGLPTINNNDPLVISHWQQLLRRLSNATPAQQKRLLTAMSTGYVIEPPTDSSAAAPFYQTPEFTIRRPAQPLPRAYFVTDARFVENAAAALQQLEQPDFDVYREVVIIGDSNKLSPVDAATNDRAAVVKWVEDSPQQLTVAVNASTAGYLVLTDTFYPGWVAQVNDRPQPIYQANAAFRAVALPAGQHQVRFVYRPFIFILGLGLSLVTLILVGGLLLLQHRLPVINHFKRG